MSVTRPARDDEADSRFIHELSMDAEILALSTRGRLFTFAEHQEWYRRRLQDSRIYIIFGSGDQPLGYVRWGEAKPGRWEVSIAMVRYHRRHGHAQVALTETQPEGTMVALVLVGNDAAARFFESCGYKLVGWEERMGKQHARYEKVR